MRQIIRLATILAVLSPMAVLAQQQDNSYQTRLLFHPTVDISKHWFAAGWVIGNIRSGVPNNFNLFGGIGFRGKNWTLETLYQKQFSKKGNSQALDFRLTKPLSKRILLYAEAAPSLGKTVFYDFVFVEREMRKRLGLGVETENVHKPGRDSLGAGPFVSYVLASSGNTKVVFRAAYQVRRGEPNVLRFYLAVHTRFRRHR